MRVAAILSFLLWSQIVTAQPKHWEQPLPDAFPNLYCTTTTCNAYALVDGDVGVLINLGTAEPLQHLDALGVKKLEWVLFTSHHRENCQGAHQLDRSITNVAASEVEKELFESPLTFRKWFPKLGDKYSVYGASYVRPPQTPIEVSQALSDGETFRWGDYEFHCISTPGNSPGGMTFILEQDGKKIAFTGGVMRNCARMTNWFDTEWDYGFAKGVDTLIASVDKLIAEEIDSALPSQGPLIREAHSQFQAYHKKLTRFRESYVRGYPVFDKDIQKRDPISQPTPVAHINQVTPHLYKLSHLHQGRNFAIIISDRGHGLVLDCGLFPKSVLEEIVVGLREHMGLKQIDAFWISHMHGDHFLLGPMMKEKFGAEAWTLDRIVDRCENPRHFDYAALVSAYGDGFDGMKIEKPFRDGETVEWEGYTIHIDWMPGQTEFGCCLWLEIDGKRIAFTGDNLFGSPSDETQNGHEAVVCRNSAILEEGYVLGSKHLLDLKPDIVMGSHSYVMPEPHQFLERYHAWSKEMVELYEEILPRPDYEYSFDPYWVSAYPYRVELTPDKPAEVEITVRNFRDKPERHHIELQLPPGVHADNAVLEGTVDANGETQYLVQLSINKMALHGIQMIPFDIQLDDKHHGQLFDFLIRVE